MRKSAFTMPALILALGLVFSACDNPPNDAARHNANAAATANSNTNPHPSPTAHPALPPAPMFTLPMLNAFLANEAFTQDVKRRLQLSDEQIRQLKTLVEAARKQTINQEQADAAFYARQFADERVRAVLGAEKTQQLAALVNDYWNGAGNAASSAPPASNAAPTALWNAVPADTRIVVNAPAYRMDVFTNGQLMKSYKIGIGYPEFPLPTGQRQAKEIIFNPTWTPPDEPWVESSPNVKAGEKVEAGSKLNPLGIAKIPIGMPSLIHGGKKTATIGGFASHGCVGLTDNQLRDFIHTLAQASGTALTVQEITAYQQKRDETKIVKLQAAVPVELRYETIVVEDGKLHIYRDVYDMDTNTAENLRMVLSKYGVRLEDLSADERTQVLTALQEMSRDAKGNLGSAPRTDKVAATKHAKTADKKSDSARVTRSVKGAKEVVIDIAALSGKGYPAPLALNTGGAKSLATTAMPKRR
ncbi:MAG: L,D-transpeptidase [Acidobacteria bacterium]|nr:L,D-transpeptidase [Acidobacteriota bacterium]